MKNKVLSKVFSVALAASMVLSGCGVGSSNVAGNLVTDESGNSTSESDASSATGETESTDDSAANEGAGAEASEALGDTDNADGSADGTQSTDGDSEAADGKEASSTDETAAGVPMYKIAKKTFQDVYDGDKTFKTSSNDPGDGVICYGQYASLIMSDEYKAAYPNLYEFLNSKATTDIENAEDRSEEIRTDARNTYESAIAEDYMFYGPYYYQEDLELTRADDTVLSVLSSLDVFNGGFHNFYNEYTVVYDVQSGNELGLGEVVTGSEDDLNKILAEKLHANEYDETEFYNLEETLTHYKFDPQPSESTSDENSTEEYNDNAEYPYTWYLAGDGLHIVFNAYEITSYNYGDFDVLIGYDEYDGFINEKFIPDESDGYVVPSRAYIGSEEYDNELRKDGEIHLSYSGEYPTGNKLNLLIDGNSASLEKDFSLADESTKLFKVKRKDGRKFAYVIVNEPDDCYDLFIFEITDEKPVAVSAETYKKSLEEVANGFIARPAFTNPEIGYAEQMGDTLIAQNPATKDDN